jgi:hypothetical protein
MTLSGAAMPVMQKNQHRKEKIPGGCPPGIQNLT